jgi:hypothetical protein
VNVQALVTDHLREAVLSEPDDVGAEDVAVEGVRPLPVGDRDDRVVEPEA